MVSPAFSFSSRSLGRKVIFTVAINSSAGNFCKSTFGACQRFLALSGSLSENKRSDPFDALAKDQVALGLAIHCHCNPGLLVLNSSDSAGEVIADLLPTFGFAWTITGSPFPSPSLSIPITGQSLIHFIGCK